MTDVPSKITRRDIAAALDRLENGRPERRHCAGTVDAIAELFGVPPDSAPIELEQADVDAIRTAAEWLGKHGGPDTRKVGTKLHQIAATWDAIYAKACDMADIEIPR